MTELLFWWWVALAAILIVAEVFASGFYLLPFGLGAAVAAVVQFAHGAVVWQLTAFAVVSVASLVIVRRLASATPRDPLEGVGADRLVGRVAMVIEDINELGTVGRVRVQKEEWRAEPSTRQIIPFGTTVLIERVDGPHLIVRPENAADPHLHDHAPITATPSEDSSASSETLDA